MADFASEVQRAPSGCGIRGCLFAAVALFVILLIGLLVIAYFRFSEPPQGIRMPGITIYPLSAADRPEPTADDRRPTTRVVGTEGRPSHA